MDSSFFFRHESLIDFTVRRFKSERRSICYRAGTCVVTSWSMRFSWFWKLTSRINIIEGQLKLWMSLKSVSGVCHLSIGTKGKPTQNPQFIHLSMGFKFFLWVIYTLFVEVKNMYFFSDIMHKSRKINELRMY